MIILFFYALGNRQAVVSPYTFLKNLYHFMYKDTQKNLEEKLRLGGKSEHHHATKIV